MVFRLAAKQEFAWSISLTIFRALVKLSAIYLLYIHRVLGAEFEQQ